MKKSSSLKKYAGSKIIGPTAVHFEEMTWPRIGNELHTLEWKLRYGNPTKAEILYAASICAAYVALAYKTQKQRNYICSQLLETESEILANTTKSYK